MRSNQRFLNSVAIITRIKTKQNKPGKTQISYIKIFRMDRFAECNERSLQNFIEKSKKTNTTKAASQWMRVTAPAF